MKACTIESCEESVKFKGLCSYHYYRKRDKGDAPLHPSKRWSMVQICEVIDCSNEVQATLLCKKHYRTYLRWKVSKNISTVSAFVVKQAIKNSTF